MLPIAMASMNALRTATRRMSSASSMQLTMKMRCENAGAGYAIHWVNVKDKFVVADDFVTDSRKAVLKKKGFDSSFAVESEKFALDAKGDGPVAQTFKNKTPTFIKDVASSNMKRKDLAAKYGIGQIAWIPFEEGVLEFGTSDGPCTADWDKMPDMALTGDTLQAAMKARCETAGAGYAIYWMSVRDKLVVANDFVTDSRKAVLKKKGFDKSFAEESELFAMDAKGDGPVATAYRTKEPVFIKDVAASNMKRKALAAKYGIGQICWVPFEKGVLEFGTSDGPCTADWDKMPEL